MNLAVFDRTRKRMTQETSKNSHMYMRDRSIRDRPLNFMYQDDSDFLEPILPKFRNRKQTEAAKSIVAGMIVSVQHDPDQRISYSRDKNYWRDTQRYHQAEFTAETFIPVIDKLAAEGFMALHDVTRRGDRGCRSSFLPAEFLEYLKAPGFTRRPGELIRLKDADKHLVDYRDTDKTEAERRVMRSINEAISGHSISIETPHGVRDGDLVRFARSCVNLGHTDLYRVFNTTWVKGGRMYGGWWQSVPGDQREQYMLIDGRPVAEEDYSQLHARMLYRLEGWILPDDEDAYSIDGFDRSVVKVAFHILINADGYDSARNAVAFKTGLTHGEAKALINSLKAKHVLISNHFHSGLGLKMQFLDSAIAKTVMKEMMLRNDVCCLPVHDSFIVPSEHRDMLVDVMRRAYEEAMSKATGGSVSRDLKR
jgi:hypothetical protein